jgi:rsbT antagonist protein RsbS
MMADQAVSIIEVHDVLIVTMPADPDDATVTELQEQILNAMDRTKAKGLVLDISNVETLDSFFARTIVETGQMTHLMGCSTVVAGMRPSVAITATQLGLSMKLSRVSSAVNVDKALDMLTELPRRRQGNERRG